MCRRREVPFDAEVTAEAHDEESLAGLRNAVIRCVEHSHHDVVSRSLPPLRVELL